MIIMLKALLVFALVCLVSWLVVTCLYLRLHVKDLMEELSRYKDPVPPVSVVLSEPEEHDAEE